MLSKAKISGCDANDKPINTNWFYVQYNPSTLQIQEPCRQGIGQKKPADDKSMLSDHVEMTTELFFNTLTSLQQKHYEDVRGYIRKFYPFTNQDKKEKEKLKKICFSWGTLCIVGFLEQLQIKYTMFSPEGIAVRAQVTITIRGSYYGEMPKGLTTKKEEALEIHGSFMDALRDFKEPQNWKREAKKHAVTKARV